MGQRADVHGMGRAGTKLDGFKPYQFTLGIDYLYCCFLVDPCCTNVYHIRGRVGKCAEGEPSLLQVHRNDLTVGELAIFVK